jgi:hypothetical protein
MSNRLTRYQELVPVCGSPSHANALQILRMQPRLDRADEKATCHGRSIVGCRAGLMLLPSDSKGKSTFSDR